MAKDGPAGCLVGIFRVLGIGGGRSAAAGEMPYRRKEFLFSRAEASFFGVLNQAVAGKYLVFAKVRLCDVIDVKPRTGSWQTARNRIQSKHVDFLLCHRDGVRPCLVIELDDSSHQRESTRAGDEFKDEALAAAGLPILRVRARGSYDVGKVWGDIVEQIRS